jgi:hypothetical protein
VTYKTGFGFDDWIYCTLYIHTVRDYRQYSAIAILHTLQFTVAHAPGFLAVTSRILATDLSQSHWHFNSHMKSSWHNVILFFPFMQLPIPKTRPDPTRPDSTTLNYCSILPATLPTLLLSQSQSESYFTTGGLPPITSSWRQAP